MQITHKDVVARQRQWKTSAGARKKPAHRSTRWHVAHHRSRWAIAALLLLFLASGVSGKDYEVKLHRPEKEGDQYRVSLRGTWIIGYKYVLRSAGEEPVGGVPDDRQLPPPFNQVPAQKYTSSIELDADVKILRVDEGGHLLKMALTVRHWKFICDLGERVSFDANGKVIIAETVDGKTTFSIEGQELGEYDHRMLGIVVKTYTGGISDDARYGSKRNHKIGDTWMKDFDASLFEGALPDDTESEQVNIQGKSKVKLSGVEFFEGIECLRIEASAKHRQFVNRVVDERDTTTLKKLEVTSTFRAKFPTDMKSRSPHSYQKRGMSYIISSPESEKSTGVMVETSLIETVERTVTTPKDQSQTHNAHHAKTD